MRKTTDHTMGFSDLQWELVVKLAKEHRVSKTEVNRKVYDFAIDHDAELGLPFLTAKKKAGQAEVDAADGIIRELEAKQKAGNTGPPKVVFEKPIGSTNGAARTAPTTEREEFEHFVGNLPDPSMLGVVSLKKVNEMLKAHPEWRDHPERLEWLRKALEEQGERNALLGKPKRVQK